MTGSIKAIHTSQQVPATPKAAPSFSPNFLQQPAQNNPVARTRELSQPKQEVQPVQYLQPKQEAQPVQYLQPAPVVPAAGGADAMNTPTWWIQTPSTVPSPLSNMQEAPSRLPNQEQKMLMEQDRQMLPSDRVTHIRPAKRSRNNVGRRRVIATLAAGSVVAAGALIAGKMNLAHLVTPLNTHTAQGNPTASGQQKTTINTGTGAAKATATPNVTNNPVKTAPTAPTAKVLGATSLTANTSIDIVNPADGKAGLLIHLPNGNFVAYERACTHVGVEVNYDPMTHTLVCPAHGSVFDPLNKAAVLQGPATRPLPPIALRVNANGTITAG